MGPTKLIPPDRDASKKNRISSSPITTIGPDGKAEQYGTSYEIHSHFHNVENLSVVRLRHVNDTPAAEQEACEQKHSRPGATKENEFAEIEECQASYFEILEGGISVFRKAAYRTDFSGICRSIDGPTNSVYLPRDDVCKWRWTHTRQINLVGLNRRPEWPRVVA